MPAGYCPLENYLSTDNLTRSKQPASAAEVLSIGEFLPHLCSAGAGLTGSPRVDGLQHTPSVFGFVREFREEGSPTYILYRLGEHSTSQALDVQIFDGHYTEVLDQPERKLVLKLVSLVLDSLVNLLQQCRRFTTTMRTLLTTGNFALGTILGAPHQAILEREQRTSVDSVAIISHDRTGSRYSISVTHLVN